jgi:hypothetical protein
MKASGNSTTDGSGAITVVSPAKSAVAPTVPRRLYIYSAIRGKAQARIVLKKVLPAMAEAATGLYATTRYVNTEVKVKQIPAPNGMDAIIGTTQWTCL